MAIGKYRDWLTDDGLAKLEQWARDGLTDEQMAYNMGIHVATIYEWKNKYPEISDAIKRGKQVVNLKVENALLKSALGYEYEEMETFITKDENGKENMRVRKNKKHMAANVTAQIFWLKNRKPEDWREKQNVEYSGHVEISNGVDDIKDFIENLKKKDASGKS